MKKEEKKILIIANSIVGDPPGISGGESRIIELAKVWKKMGYEIHLLSSYSGKFLFNSMGLDVIFHNLTDVTTESRLEVIRRLFLMYKIPKLLNSFKSGIIYSASEQVYDVLPGVILKIIHGRKIRLGVAVHWLPPLLFWRRENSTFIQSLLYLISERVGLILAKLFGDTMLPVSQSTLNDLLKENLAIKNTNVVECGVDLGAFEVIRKKTSKKIYDAVFIKRLQAVKGVFDLISIWKKVIEKIPSATLIVIGEGIDGAKFRNLIEKEGLSENIRVLGVIYDFDEKVSLLCESKVFVLPSSEENWAIVIGESLASGVPVICYDLPELRKVWEDSVTYVPLGDTKQFADKFIELYSNSSLYKKISLNGLNYVKRYSWDKIAELELFYLK